MQQTTLSTQKNALLKQKENGVYKKLICLSLSNSTAIHGMEAIYRNGICVGFLRRAGYSFSTDKSIGYGYIKHHNNEIITNKYIREGEYHIDVMGTKYEANYEKKCVYDPDNIKIKNI